MTRFPTARLFYRVVRLTLRSVPMVSLVMSDALGERDIATWAWQSDCIRTPEERLSDAYKKAYLIAHVRATCHTFKDRAREMRMIHGAASEGLAWVFDALDSEIPL